MPRPNNVPHRPRAKKGTLGRLLRFVFKDYKGLLLLEMLCIALFALVSVAPAIYVENIAALIEEGLKAVKDTGASTSAEYVAIYEGIAPRLIGTVLTMICVYVVGLLCAFTYTRLGAIITQGFLHNMRKRMFDHMQTLPVKYFDTNNHGDIMSYYTNDIDTLRQLISQSLPAVFQAALTLVTLSCIMMYFSVWLFMVVLLGVVAMTCVAKGVGGRSARYFMQQQ
ncbi:MAG: ABC transporter ATP-binding protein, partial [Clostridia bacterium]|nr:ABC transporter ATP-binding protein [Clostridia bacterium]